MGTPKVKKTVRTNHSGRVGLFSEEMIEDLAGELGCPISDARTLILAHGRVVHRRLLNGLPCGIPTVGTIYVDHNLAGRTVVANYKGKGCRNEKHVRSRYKYPRFARPAFKPMTQVRRDVRDKAVFRGTLEAIYAKRQAKRRKEADGRRRKRR